MSETKQYSGKIKLIPKHAHEDFQGQCKRMLGERFPDYEIHDSYEYSSQLFDVSHMGFVNNNTDLYEIINLIEEDPNDCWIKMTKIDDGIFTFNTSYYNGGTCLDEMIEHGLKKLEDEA